MSRLALLEGAKLNLAEVTILAAGANPIEVDVLMQVFSGFGARRLRRAEDPQSARALLEREAIDLFVLDAMMGLEAGMELVRGLRRLPSETRLAPVILAAGHVQPSLIREARANGVSYVVAKPLTPRVLFERLVWVVRDARAFVETADYAGPDRRVRALGPPPGMAGRRADDLPFDVGEASTPNMSQADIDAMMMPVRRAR